MHKILIIDDEKDICFLIAEILKDENYITNHAVNSDEALIKFNDFNPDLIILDVWLSNSKLEGIELLKQFKNLNSKIPVIIISGHGTVDLAVKAIKNGAYDFLEKPFNSDKLIILSKRAIENSILFDDIMTLDITLGLLNILALVFVGIEKRIHKIFKIISLSILTLFIIFLIQSHL